MSIQEAYNVWAAQYDYNHNRTRDLDGTVIKKVLKNYQYQNVLELGCGTGKNTIFLSESSESLLGIDFSEEMLSVARQKISANHVEFIQADLKEKWDFTEQHFDLITCNLTLEHFQYLNPFFVKVTQKLKKEGLFLISELHPFRQYTGSKAKFEVDGGTEELEVYLHHISDYLEATNYSGLKLIEINEWFDEGSPEPRLPRLISFVLQKITV